MPVRDTLEMAMDVPRLIERLAAALDEARGPPSGARRGGRAGPGVEIFERVVIAVRSPRREPGPEASVLGPGQRMVVDPGLDPDRLTGASEARRMGSAAHDP